MNITPPTRTFCPFDGCVEIRLFGRLPLIGGKPQDQSIAKVKTMQDTKTDKEAKKAFDGLWDKCRSAGIQKIFAPSPALFNAEIIEKNKLGEEISWTGWAPGEYDAAGGGMDDLKYGGGDNLVLLRGAQADGVILEKGDAFYLSSADCPTVALFCQQTGQAVAFHAGRDSLFDRKSVIEGGEKRELGSVVHAALSRFREVYNVEAFITCGCGPENFPHFWNDPRYGEANRKMTMHFVETCGTKAVHGDQTEGRLDLTEIIKAQLRQGIPYRQDGREVPIGKVFGIENSVKEENIRSDGIDTYAEVLEKHEFGEEDHVWHSNRRAYIAKNGEEKMRNGVLVIRRL